MAAVATAVCTGGPKDGGFEASGLSGGDWWDRTEDAQGLWDACEAFEPHEKPRWLPWAIENIVNQDQHPYDHASYPHLGAPGGPGDAFDDPRIREIFLQFGSRLGKTFFGQSVMMFVADVDPAPSMHANATETLCKQVIERTYVMLRQRPRLRALLRRKHEKDWKQNEIEFVGNMLYGAWSRSVTTLADKDVKTGHSAEIDKWEHASTSKEAHPRKLYTDRFKNYWSVRKDVGESTPTVKGQSLIESLRLTGTDCRLNVPCPHCRRYQPLEFGGVESSWGLKWDHDENGRSNPDLAHKTAHYVCRHCEERCENHHRSWMIRRGVWVPRGCEVDDAAALRAGERRMRPLADDVPWRGWKHADWIRGNPLRDGETASYLLSSLYALSLSWSDIAKEFVGCCHRPQLLRNFINQWLAETWEPRKVKSTPELVADRLTVERDGICPEWTRFLVATADRQAADGGFVKWVIEAHGLEERCEVIRRGVSLTLEEFWDEAVDVLYPHADGGEPLQPVVSGVDSGWDTKRTYEFCNTREACLPLKGSDGSLGGEPYRLVELGKQTRTGAEGQILLHVATDFWETDLQDRLDSRQRDEPACLNLAKSVGRDLEFLDELLNGVLTDAKTTRGNDRLLWIKKDEDAPNDYRDAVRYGLCLARAWLDQHGMPQRFLRGAQAPARKKPTALSYSDGTPFFISER